MNQTVWVLGDAVVDLIPDGENHYLRCPGGAPANVAVGIARLGGKSAFIGKVGDDPLGIFMHKTLQQENVDIDYMTLDPQHRTSTVIVDLDAHGERTFTFMVNPSADQFLQKTELPHFTENQWLHCCSIALLSEPSRSTTLTAMENIKQQQGFISFDPNLRESLWNTQEEMINTVWKAIVLADVVKFSEDELKLLCQTETVDEAVKQITHHYPEKLIIITLGKQGSIYYFKGKTQKVVGKTVTPIDTTGAGDAFVGGLLHGLASHIDWQNSDDLTAIIQQANACGALATTAKGAMSALPNQSQLTQFLNDK